VHAAIWHGTLSLLYIMINSVVVIVITAAEETGMVIIITALWLQQYIYTHYTGVLKSEPGLILCITQSSVKNEPILITL